MINKKVERSDKALFELNGKPSWGLAFPQAMQHVLAMLVGNITPPILIAQLLGLPESDKIILMQAAMLIGGITTSCIWFWYGVTKRNGCSLCVYANIICYWFKLWY